MTTKARVLRLDPIAAPVTPVAGDVWNEMGDSALHAKGTPLSVDTFVGPMPVLLIRSTDTTTNLSGTVVVPFVELFGVVAEDTQPGAFTASLASAAVRINQSGVYEILGHHSFVGGLSSNSARANIASFFTVAGTRVSPNYQNNYMRDASGHNETSQQVSLIRRFAGGDVVTLNRQRISGSGGTINLQTTENFIAFKRIA